MFIRLATGHTGNEGYFVASNGEPTSFGAIFKTLKL